MIRTPHEIAPPGKPAFSTKERFAEMRECGAQIWREANGLDSIETSWTQARKPKKTKTRWKDAALYR